MKKFCLRVVAFLLLQAFLFFAFVWDGNLSRETGYLAATLDKHKRLEQTRPPRIILIGSSSFAFGVRSDRLERESGRTVVNMGLDSSLGVDFIFEEVKRTLREGDCVVLSVEASMLSGGIFPMRERQVLDYRPASVAYVTSEVKRKLLNEHVFALPGSWVRRSLGMSYSKLLPRRIETTYSRAGFNAWGDYVAHYAATNNMATPAATDPSSASPSNAGWGRARPAGKGLHRKVEAFASLCQKRGVLFVFTSPPQPREYLERHYAMVNGAMDFLRSIPGLLVLDAPEDHLYDLSLFYDTYHHLTKAGVDLRTAKLVQELRMVLSRESGKRDSKGP